MSLSPPPSEATACTTSVAGVLPDSGGDGSSGGATDVVLAEPSVGAPTGGAGADTATATRPAAADASSSEASHIDAQDGGDTVLTATATADGNVGAGRQPGSRSLSVDDSHHPHRAASGATGSGSGLVGSGGGHGSGSTATGTATRRRARTLSSSSAGRRLVASAPAFAPSRPSVPPASAAAHRPVFAPATATAGAGGGAAGAGGGHGLHRQWTLHYGKPEVVNGSWRANQTVIATVGTVCQRAIVAGIGVPAG